MRWLLNTAYVLMLTALSPLIAWRLLKHGRYRRGLAEKLFGRLAIRHDGRPIAWFHAVSVGEVIQLGKVVDEFRTQTSDRFSILVSTSTDSGYDLARQRFPGCQLTWFPLDFSWAVREAIRRISPALVVLMELELWPNFLAECHTRLVPVAVVNARLSERSHRGYSRILWLIAPLFRHLNLVAAQSQTYADRLQSLGVPAESIRISGSIKFDGVETSRRNPKTQQLRELFGLSDDEIVFMAGSTQEPEEQLALDAWQHLREHHPNLRLILVPRHRERFEDVAGLVAASGATLLRRSALGTGACPHPGLVPADRPVILLDSIGELSACWGLADIAFVGGSFGNRGGQNMIEPAAYGACILFGPNTWNFRDVVQSFRAASACVPLESPAELLPMVGKLVADSADRRRLGDAAQTVVLQQQGATISTAVMLADLIARSAERPQSHRNAA